MNEVSLMLTMASGEQLNQKATPSAKEGIDSDMRQTLDVSKFGGGVDQPLGSAMRSAELGQNLEGLFTAVHHSSSPSKAPNEVEEIVRNQLSSTHGSITREQSAQQMQSINGESSPSAMHRAGSETPRPRSARSRPTSVSLASAARHTQGSCVLPVQTPRMISKVQSASSIPKLSAAAAESMQKEAEQRSSSGMAACQRQVRAGTQSPGPAPRRLASGQGGTLTPGIGGWRSPRQLGPVEGPVQFVVASRVSNMGRRKTLPSMKQGSPTSVTQPSIILSIPDVRGIHAKPGSSLCMYVPQATTQKGSPVEAVRQVSQP